MTSAKQAPDRNLAMELVRVTEAAALAASRWMGRGDKEGADGAAVNAMRIVLSSIAMDGVVPSIGSTAMSALGGLPSPIRSPL